MAASSGPGDTAASSGPGDTAASSGPGETAASSVPDVTSSAIYLEGVPDERFAAMRSTPGLTWHPYGDDGFWAVTRHADIREVSRNPGVFSSAIGHTNLWDL